MTVAQQIAARLKAFNTEYVFLLTGGDQPLWIALRDSGIKMAVTRSEFSGVYMADGYARASGKPGITYGQAGPGEPRLTQDIDVVLDPDRVVRQWRRQR